MSWLNWLAPSNILSMVVTFDTSVAHLYNGWLNADASWNIPSIMVTLLTDQSFNDWSNFMAPLNIFFMFDTSCVFQFDMSSLNPEQSSNMLSIFVTFDTSHFVMSDTSLLSKLLLLNVLLISSTLETSHISMRSIASGTIPVELSPIGLPSDTLK